jgi:hypothetical protein
MYKTRALTPYAGNTTNFRGIMESSRALNNSNLDDRLKTRDKYLDTTHRHTEGHTFLQILLKNCEAIKFAADWKRRGRQPGGKKFKTNFASSIYEARTGKRPPDPKHASKEDKIAFKRFKAQHQSLVTSRNDLLNMYREVRFLI